MVGNLSSKSEIDGGRGSVVVVADSDPVARLLFTADGEEKDSEDGAATFETRKRAGFGGGGGL